MASTNKLLSLDMGTHDCFYRFRRDFEATSTVIYVYLQDLDIIAQDRQTYGPDVIQDLRDKVDVWDQQWTTLTVFRDGGRIQYRQDQWEPHYLPKEVASGTLPRLNFLNLDIQHSFKNRVFLVHFNMERQVLKICPFQSELPYFTQEMKVYKTLSERGCDLIPRLSAYVYERSEEQIIGFVCEELHGRVAELDDHDECKRSLAKLHTYGIIHGDLNKFNIMITKDGARFFDLEKSILDTDGEISQEDFSRLQQEELEGLKKALSDEEGWGRPWPESERS